MPDSIPPVPPAGAPQPPPPPNVAPPVPPGTTVPPVAAAGAVILSIPEKDMAAIKAASRTKGVAQGKTEAEKAIAAQFKELGYDSPELGLAALKASKEAIPPPAAPPSVPPPPNNAPAAPPVVPPAGLAAGDVQKLINDAIAAEQAKTAAVQAEGSIKVELAKLGLEDVDYTYHLFQQAAAAAPADKPFDTSKWATELKAARPALFKKAPPANSGQGASTGPAPGVGVTSIGHTRTFDARKATHAELAAKQRELGIPISSATGWGGR